MSLFGQSTGGQQGGGLFGGQTKPLFGGLGQNAQQGNTAQPAPFGGLGQAASQNTQQQPQNPQAGPSGLFSGLGQNTQQNQQSTGLFGGLGQGTQQPQQQQAGQSLFGGGLGQNNQQNQQQSGGLFGSLSNPQNQQQPGGIFSQSTVKNLPQLGQSQLVPTNNALGGSLWQPGSAVKPRRFLPSSNKAMC
jgi:hypothetical protein